MSEVISVPGMLVSMRTLRRFSHYMAGEIIAVPLDAGRDMHAKRLAEPLNIMVPAQPRKEEPEGDPPVPMVPLRQPGGTVRK